jgi:hypothetical protein
MTFASRLIVLGAVLALLIGAEWALYVKARNAGRHEVQAQWDAKIKAAEQQVLQEEKRQQKAATKIVTNVVANAAKERVVYRDIIKEIPHYVPTDLPVLPGSFRLLHAAAARGSELPEDRDSSRADAATVSVETLAETIVENYRACREDRARLEGLQAVVGNSD